MRTYSELSNDEKKIMQDILKRGESELETNSLIKFYARMYEFVNHKDDAKYIGHITEFFEECGIDTAGAILHYGIIPANYCYDAPVPDKFLDEGELYTHHKIKKICENAFFNSKGFEMADLRGVQVIDYMAFGQTDLNTLTFNDTIISVDKMAFMGTDIKEVWVENGSHIDRVKRALEPALNSTNFTPLENIEWVNF